MTRVIELDEILDLVPTSKGIFAGNGVYFNQRLPTDPYFYAPLTIQNVIDGSHYWVAQTSNLSNVLGSGVQSGSGDIVISSIPALESPMLTTIRIRKLGYIPFETNAFLYSSGGLSYIIQTVDIIVT